MDNVIIERGCFVGLVTSAVEAYNRETNGFLVGFHSHTWADGAASLSATDLEYVSDELKRLSRSRSMDRTEWLEVVVALRPREWSRRHEAGWTTRRYRRKLGCTVAIDPTHGYDMTIGGYWIEGEPD